MFEDGDDTWNLRDTHMVDTLDALEKYLDTRIVKTKAVVWAHNSHLGDARHTDVSRHGQINVGQLVRQRWGDDAFLLGYTTFEGSVTAADNWDEPARQKRVIPALEGSYERLLHECRFGDGLLLLRDDSEMRDALMEPRLERAIGVIYRPHTERMSHYFEATLPKQFDAVIHFDTTSSVRPLETLAALDDSEVDETFPTGF